MFCNTRGSTRLACRSGTPIKQGSDFFLFRNLFSKYFSTCRQSGLTCTDWHDVLQGAGCKDELAIAPLSYRETAHGKGKHMAGLQAGTPGDEAIITMERGGTVFPAGRHTE